MEYDNITNVTAAQLIRLLVQGQALGGSSSIIRTVRIVDAELWGMNCVSVSDATNSNRPVSIYIEYPSSSNLGLGSPDLRRSDTSLGSATPAHVHYPPPKNALSGMWLNDSGNVVLSIRYPRFAIFDLVLEIVLQDSTAVYSANTTLAGAGINYMLRLDHGAGLNVWEPVGYNTTT